jgi:predicted tellurium resistance membrane protein TerC
VAARGKSLRDSGEARALGGQRLSRALGGSTVFVGLKMAASHCFDLNTYISLATIFMIMVAAIWFSVRRAATLALPPRTASAS